MQRRDEIEILLGLSISTKQIIDSLKIRKMAEDNDMPVNYLVASLLLTLRLLVNKVLLGNVMGLVMCTKIMGLIMYTDFKNQLIY